ncbi:hypothetical protein Ahia01_001070600, partial [Argonauta hians]
EHVVDMLQQQSAVFGFIIKWADNPATAFILLAAFSLLIFYLWSISRSLKENNTELKNTLEYERTEGKKKVYALADAKRSQLNPGIEPNNVTNTPNREVTSAGEVTLHAELSSPEHAMKIASRITWRDVVARQYQIKPSKGKFPVYPAPSRKNPQENIQRNIVPSWKPPRENSPRSIDPPLNTPKGKYPGNFDSFSKFPKGNIPGNIVPSLKEPNGKFSENLAPSLKPPKGKFSENLAPSLKPPKGKFSENLAPSLKPPKGKFSENLAPSSKPPKGKFSENLAPSLKPPKGKFSENLAPSLKPPKGKTPGNLALSPVSTSALVSAPTKPSATKVRVLNPRTTVLRAKSAGVTSKPNMSPWVLSKRNGRHGRGSNRRHSSLQHLDRQTQRLKYSSHLDEIRLAKLRQFQLSREIQQLESELRQWNRDRDICIADTSFTLSQHQPQLYHRNTPSISDVINTTVYSSSEVGTSDIRGSEQHLRKQRKGWLPPGKPFHNDNEGTRSSNPQSHVDPYSYKSYFEHTRPDIDSYRSLDLSEYIRGQTSPDLDPRRSNPDKSGLNSDQSMYFINPVIPDVDLGSYCDQHTSQAGNPESNLGSNVNYPGSNIDQPLSFIDECRSNTLQYRSDTDHLRSNIDSQRSYTDWSGPLLEWRDEAEDEESVVGLKEGGSVGRSPNLTDIFSKFGFNNMAFDRNT